MLGPISSILKSGLCHNIGKFAKPSSFIIQHVDFGLYGIFKNELPTIKLVKINEYCSCFDRNFGNIRFLNVNGGEIHSLTPIQYFSLSASTSKKDHILSFFQKIILGSISILKSGYKLGKFGQPNIQHVDFGLYGIFKNELPTIQLVKINGYGACLNRHVGDIRFLNVNGGSIHSLNAIRFYSASTSKEDPTSDQDHILTFLQKKSNLLKTMLGPISSILKGGLCHNIGNFAKPSSFIIQRVDFELYGIFKNELPSIQLVKINGYGSCFDRNVGNIRFLNVNGGAIHSLTSIRYCSTSTSKENPTTNKKRRFHLPQTFKDFFNLWVSFISICFLISSFIGASLFFFFSSQSNLNAKIDSSQSNLTAKIDKLQENSTHLELKLNELKLSQKSDIMDLIKSMNIIEYIVKGGKEVKE